MMAVDKVVTATQWLAAFNKSLGEGKSHEDAVIYAQEIVAKYQPTAHAKDQPFMFRTGNEFVNLIAQFTRQQNQIWGMLVHELPRAASQPKTLGKAAAIATAVGLNSYMVWAIRNGRVPETEDDFRDIASDATLGNLPYVGKMIGSTYGERAPWAEMGDVANALISDKAWQDKVAAVMPDILGIGGVPVVGGRRVLTAIEEQRIDALMGMAR